MDPLETKEHLERSHTAINPYDPFTRFLTILTSTIALLAAFAGIMSARCTTRGMVAKNDAILVQSELTDDWAFFQSRNVRFELAELANEVHLIKNAKSSDLYLKRMAQFDTERKEFFRKSKSLESSRSELSSLSDSYLEIARLFAVSLVLFQVALIFVTTSLVMRSRTLVTLSLSLAAVSLFYFFHAYLGYFPLTHLQKVF